MTKRKKTPKPEPPKLKLYCATFPVCGQKLPDQTTWNLDDITLPHVRGCSIRDNSVLCLVLAYTFYDAAMQTIDRSREVFGLNFSGQTTVQVYSHLERPENVHYVRL